MFVCMNRCGLCDLRVAFPLIAFVGLPPSFQVEDERDEGRSDGVFRANKKAGGQKETEESRRFDETGNHQHSVKDK